MSSFQYVTVSLGQNDLPDSKGHLGREINLHDKDYPSFPRLFVLVPFRNKGPPSSKTISLSQTLDC